MEGLLLGKNIYVIGDFYCYHKNVSIISFKFACVQCANIVSIIKLISTYRIYFSHIYIFQY